MLTLFLLAEINAVCDGNAVQVDCVGCAAFLLMLRPVSTIYALSFISYTLDKFYNVSHMCLPFQKLSNMISCFKMDYVSYFNKLPRSVQPTL